jgi:hypothetical protein
VDLVQEEDRALALRSEALAGAGDHGADVGDGCRDRRQLLERGAGPRGDDSRERGLAGSGRAEEDRRPHPVLVDRPAERGALAEHVLLADELVERARP